MKTTLIIDADSLVYQATTASLNYVEWAPGAWTVDCQMADVLAHFQDQVGQVQEELGGDEIVMALSDYDHPCFRLDVLPSYKENRTKGYKPLCFWPLREWISENYETFVRPTLEGDDVCGILLTRPSFKKGRRKILVAVDKDMATLPGLHCNLYSGLHRGEWDVVKIPPKQADYNHMIQTLTGDRTDNYAGCPGIGPVKATRLLAGKARGEFWPTVVGAYEKAGLTEEDALVQARVARILRASDYDFKNKAVRLWTP